jgi:3-polyprenyl-4-hydroxybenzoate decarboxylase
MVSRSELPCGLSARTPYVKYVILVDDDVDVYDDNEVLWCIATRSQPDRNIHIIGPTDGNMLDPSQEKMGITSRAIIDATRPPHMEKIPTPTIPEAVVKKVASLIR